MNYRYIFRLGAGLAAGAMLLAACGGAPAASPSIPAGSASSTPAKPAAASGSASAAPATAASASWDDLVSAGKKEGSVNVALPAGLPGVGDVFAKAFSDQYGIQFG